MGRTFHVLLTSHIPRFPWFPWEGMIPVDDGKSAKLGELNIVGCRTQRLASHYCEATLLSNIGIVLKIFTQDPTI